MLKVLALALLAAGPFDSPDPVGRDARQMRAARESCIARVGVVARSLVEAYGEDAVKALNSCTPATGRKMAEWFNGGGLNKLPQPRSLLLAVADRRSGGDDAALWAIVHEKDLIDPDGLAAYCREPLQFALHLKQLSTAAADVRGRRLITEAEKTPPPPFLSPDVEKWIRQWWLLLAGVAALIWWWWKFRRKTYSAVVIRQP